MQFLLILAYPVFAHSGVIFEQAFLMPIAIIFLAAGILLGGLKAMSWKIWLMFLGVVCLSLGLHLFNSAMFIMYIPPILVPLLLGWGFARSLVKGQVPLVTDIGEKARGPLSEEMRSYTRIVTQSWAVTLIAMACWGAALALFGDETLWSTVTNIVNQVIVAILFVGEFMYRKYRFKDHDHPTFHDYVKIVFRSQRSNTN